MVLWVLIVVL